MIYEQWLDKTAQGADLDCLGHALETLAFHTACTVETVVQRGGIRTGGCGLSADPAGPADSLRVHLEWQIHGQPEPDSDPVWDRCLVRLHGESEWIWAGNRCGLRNAIARAYAPVIAAIADRGAQVAHEQSA